MFVFDWAALLQLIRHYSTEREMCCVSAQFTFVSLRFPRSSGLLKDYLARMRQFSQTYRLLHVELTQGPTNPTLGWPETVTHQGLVTSATTGSRVTSTYAVTLSRQGQARGYKTAPFGALLGRVNAISD
jgi:hypothetical protein